MTTEELKEHFEKRFEAIETLLKEIKENLNFLNNQYIEMDRKILILEEKKLSDLEKTVEEHTEKIDKMENKIKNCKHCNGEVDVIIATKKNQLKCIYTFIINDFFKLAIILYVIYLGVKTYFKL